MMIDFNKLGWTDQRSREVAWKIQEFRRKYLGYYKVLNPSIIDFDNKRLIAFRDYCPFRNNIRIGYLEGRKISRIKIILGKKGEWGAEDPRFFVYKDNLHLSYVKTRWNQRAAPGGYGKMAYCRLDDELFPVGGRVFEEFDGVQKNWLFFEGMDQGLYAITHNDEQRVLDIENDNIIENNFEIPWPANNRTDSANIDGTRVKGIVRGGTTPIFVDGQFFSFFHVTPVNARKTARLLNYSYEMGFYSFESIPPFRVTAYTPEPLLIGNPITLPFGAILQNDVWTVSCGINDQSWDTLYFSHSELLKKMISPSQGASAKI